MKSPSGCCSVTAAIGNTQGEAGTRTKLEGQAVCSVKMWWVLAGPLGCTGRGISSRGKLGLDTARFLALVVGGGSELPSGPFLLSQGTFALTTPCPSLLLANCISRTQAQLSTCIASDVRRSHLETQEAAGAARRIQAGRGACG